MDDKDWFMYPIMGGDTCNVSYQQTHKIDYKKALQDGILDHVDNLSEHTMKAL